MKLFKIEDCDYVVAENKAQARAWGVENYGQPVEDIEEVDINIKINLTDTEKKDAEPLFKTAKEMADAHLLLGGALPLHVGIDGHYA